MAKKKTKKEITLADKTENKALAISQNNKDKKTLQELKAETKRLKEELKSKREKIGPTPLNDEEKALIERWKKKKVESHFCYNDDCDDYFYYSTKTENGTPLEQHKLIEAAFSEASGSSDHMFSYDLVMKCIRASYIGKAHNESDFASLSNSIINVLTSMKPADEIEGMLITRLIAIHNLSMHSLICAVNNEATTEGRDNNINRSTKLFRVYNETLEALMRYRRKGEQRVVVQHVNVNDGAQAMIGHFQAGGGVSRKNEEPHG